MESQPLYRGEDLKKLLLQRDPILMVDTLYSASDTQAVAGLSVVADNFFCCDGELAETGLIEHIAQSASAFVSYKTNKANPDAPALLGYIGEVKKFKLAGALPRVGDEMITTITIMSEVMGITLFTAETSVKGTVIASCQMKLSV